MLAERIGAIMKAPLLGVGQAVPEAIGVSGGLVVVTLERHRWPAESRQMRSRRVAVAESVTV